jgi:hypothetical protein
VAIDDFCRQSWVATFNATKETTDDRRDDEPSRARGKGAQSRHFENGF